MEFKPGIVYFSGAGPGDPGLITVKAAELIRQADVILYAGSLVNPAILGQAGSEAKLINTARLSLARQIEIMKQSALDGLVIARLHTGDPSLYSAIHEQISELDQLGIPWLIIPGVTAAFAAAASLGIEYTLPLACQSLILTRVEGKTPLPETESLRSFAAHHCSLAIYLSAGMIGKVIAQFRAAAYPENTSVVVASRVSWPDERCIRGTLNTIERLADEAGITHQALIIVSPALEGDSGVLSHLYGTFQKVKHRQKTAVITLSADSLKIGRLIADSLPETELYIPEKLWHPEFAQKQNAHGYKNGVRQILQETFQTCSALICLMAVGIVVRELAPCLRNKHEDPAVVVLDEKGQFVISLLSGHCGGANALAKAVAAVTHGQAVITTASDTQQLPALDLLIAEKGWTISEGSDLTSLMSAMVDHQRIGLVSDQSTEEFSGFPFEPFSEINEIPQNIGNVVIVSSKEIPPDLLRRFQSVLLLRPKTLWLGVGCNKGATMAEIDAFMKDAMEEAGLSPDAVCGLATIPEKGAEAGLLAFCEKYHFPLRLIGHEAIRQLGDLPTPSLYAKTLFDIQGVAEPCAIIAADRGRLLLEKRKSANVTLAIAEVRKDI